MGEGTPAHLHAPGHSGERQLRHSALVERNYVLAGGEQAVRKGAVGAGAAPLHPDARAGGQPVLLLLCLRHKTGIRVTRSAGPEPTLISRP